MEEITDVLATTKADFLRMNIIQLDVSDIKDLDNLALQGRINKFSHIKDVLLEEYKNPNAKNLDLLVNNITNTEYNINLCKSFITKE